MNSSAKTSYHHTNLRQALLDQAFAVVAERGLEGLSVRELARTVGVSTAAPFRHFKNRQALIVAMAELAAASLRASFLQALKDCAPLPPLERFAALGRAYVQWATAEPVYFRVMNDQAAMGEVPEMFQDHLVTLSLMGELLLPIYGNDPKRLALTLVGARALVYGLARLASDGQLRNWVPEAQILALQESVITLFTRHMAESAGIAWTREDEQLPLLDLAQHGMKPAPR